MQSTNEKPADNVRPLPTVATENPALRKVLSAVLEGAAKRDPNPSEPSQRYKEYIDCGAWTWQA